MQASEVLQRIRHRYIIVGSTGIRLHGIEWEKSDIDIWLDPTIAESDWDAAVREAACSLELPWLRGDLDHCGGKRASTRIACTPKLDVMHDVMGVQASEFEGIYDRCLKSPLGNVAPLEIILRIKLRARRHKDYRHTMKLARKILYIW
ncbi:MAG: hypothetical protein ACE361_25640 [Aureliella sp.]